MCGKYRPGHLIDIVSTGTSYFAGYVPAIQVFELPYVFASYDEAHQTLDNEPGKAIADLFESTDLKMLCYWESGMRHVTNSRNPIITPADMSGLKIRTVVSATQQATWEAFGAIRWHWIWVKSLPLCKITPLTRRKTPCLLSLLTRCMRFRIISP